MKYCKKCNKIIEKGEKTYNNFCFNCYQEYLYEKIEHLGEENISSDLDKKNNSNNFINYIKKIFSKRKK